MRGISCWMMAGVCALWAGSIGIERNSRSQPQTGVIEEMSVASAAFPSRWVGWFHWRCWDDAQRVALVLDAPTIGAGRLIVLNGRETYDVDGRWHSVAIQATVDLEERTFTLVEGETETGDGAEAPSPGPFAGAISANFSRIRPARAAVSSCEPELVLDAAHEADTEDHNERVATLTAAQTISLKMPQGD